MASRFGLKVVAGIEATKGVLVLAAGLGLFELMRHDVQAGAERLVRNFHLDPASHYPRVFLEAMERVENSHLLLLALGALAYAAMRFVEAFGLWRARRWAEWLGALSGSVYLPLEIYTMHHGLTWPRVTLFCANCIVVGYLAWLLVRTSVTPPNPPPA